MILSFVILAASLQQTSASIDTAVFDRAVMDSLRDVHDRGAKLHNDQKDYAGCFRLYEGAVRVVRPLLAHRPAVQTRIDVAFDELEKLTTPREKAFHLHELIEAVRGDLRGRAKPASKEITPSPSEHKSIQSPMPVPLNGLPTPAVPVRTTTGFVALDGKPAAACEVQFISLDQPAPTIRTIVTNSLGRFEFQPSLSAGRYAVTVSGSMIPRRYETTSESGLRVTASSASIELNLKN